MRCTCLVFKTVSIHTPLRECFIPRFLQKAIAVSIHTPLRECFCKSFVICHHKVSIHTPLRECFVAIVVKAFKQVSIHTPLRECFNMFHRTALCLPCFNPHSLTGVFHLSVYSVHFSLGFNPHSLTGVFPGFVEPFRISLFQSTLPYGSVSFRAYLYHAHKFQSTLPYGSVSQINLFLPLRRFNPHSLTGVFLKI